MKQKKIMGLLLIGLTTIGVALTPGTKVFANQVKKSVKTTNSSKFHSDIQRNLYNYMMSEEHQSQIHNEAIRLHGGILSNNCVFFASSALRAVGVDIPYSTGYTTVLEGNLVRRGWKKQTNLKELKPGDVCFANVVHAYIFMGWANEEKTMAYVVDNQKGIFGANYHLRNIYQGGSTPTTHFYTYGNIKEDLNNYNNIKVGKITSNVNLRNNPSTESDIIMQLDKYSKVNIIGETPNWYKVKYNNKIGFVHRDYLTTNLNYNTNSPNHYNSGKMGVIKVGSTLNVRNNASVNSDILGVLHNSDKVNIVGESGEWYKIAYNGETAYVFKSYVSISNDVVNDQTPADKPSEHSNKPNKTTEPQSKPNHVVNNNASTGVVSVNTTLNIRNKSGLDSDIIGVLRNNDNVEILGEEGNWYKISYNNSIGYIFKEYVHISNKNISKEKNTNIDTVKSQPVKSETSNEKIGVVSVSYKLNVRDGATLSSKIIDCLSDNDIVKVIGEDGEWYKINHNGKVAYVFKKYVCIKNDTPQNSNMKKGVKDDQESNVLTKGKVVNISSNLRVRSGNSTSNYVIGYLNNDEEVDILEYSNGWYKIKFRGHVGWACGDYIKMIEYVR